MSLKKNIIAAASLHMLAWLAVLVAFAGISFMALGCYWLLSTALPPWASALVVGAGLIIVLVLIALIAALYASRAKRRHQIKTQKMIDQRIEEKLRPALGEDATQWAKENTGLAIIVALGTGILLSSSPATRRLIYDTARPLLARKVVRILRALSGD